MKALSKST
jgi:serum/glucocorticoid-regulated kinase 2